MNDSITEQIARLDELIFPANVWGLESYRSSVLNDYDYLIAAVYNEEAKAAFTVLEPGAADISCSAASDGGNPKEVHNSNTDVNAETDVQAAAADNTVAADNTAAADNTGAADYEASENDGAPEAAERAESCRGNAAAPAVAGYALLRCFDDAEIIRIATDSRYRRQGIGSMLLDSLLTEAHKRDIHSIFLEVRSSNMPAIRLYEQAGFERAGVRRDYYSAPTEDAIIMRYTW